MHNIGTGASCTDIYWKIKMENHGSLVVEREDHRDLVVEGGITRIWY